jgi:hypothetical protein
MKNILTTFSISILFSLYLVGQAPSLISYQTIIRNNDNELISNLSWEIVTKNKLEDTEFVINEFKKLNNKYIE